MVELTDKADEEEILVEVRKQQMETARIWRMGALMYPQPAILEASVRANRNYQ